MSRGLHNRLKRLERSCSQQQEVYEAQYRSAEQLCEECDDPEIIARYETAVERLRIVEAEAENQNPGSRQKTLEVLDAEDDLLEAEEELRAYARARDEAIGSERRDGTS